MCKECYLMRLPSCVDSIKLSLGLTEGDAVSWRLSSYKQVYTGTSIVDADGAIVLQHASFSEALFIPAEGAFIFTVTQINDESFTCDTYPITICEEDYPCIAIRFEQAEAQEIIPPPEPPVCPPQFIVVKTDTEKPTAGTPIGFEAVPTNFTPNFYRWYYVDLFDNSLTLILSTTDTATDSFTVGSYTVVCLAFGDDKEQYLFNSIDISVA